MNTAKFSVLITGAASGTGLAIASLFQREGYVTFLSSRRREDAVKAAASLGGSTIGIKLDPSDGEDGVLNAFAEISDSGYSLDCLVLNAADLGIGMDLFSTPFTRWSEVMQTNVCWNFAIARQAALMMKEKGKGSILFIGSNTCRRAIKDRTAYIASKGALLSLSKALAVELGEYGIRSNCILAGPISTIRWEALSDENRKMKAARAPLKRVASYDDIANAVYFLSSSAAANISGAEFTVDGGLDAKFPE